VLFRAGPKRKSSVVGGLVKIKKKEGDPAGTGPEVTDFISAKKSTAAGRVAGRELVVMSAFLLLGKRDNANLPQRMGVGTDVPFGPTS